MKLVHSLMLRFRSHFTCQSLKLVPQAGIFVALSLSSLSLRAYVIATGRTFRTFMHICAVKL